VVKGDVGAHIEAVAIWVSVDPKTGAPIRLAPSFARIFGESASGRRVRARLSHDAPPDDAARRQWPLRFVDFDVVGHVNNAAYWAVLEEELARRRELRGELRAEMEFAGGVERAPSVELAVTDGEDSISAWFLVDGTPQASGRVTKLS
jgi:acyl-ACP thioesterase